jgi:acetyl esterase/lipase
MSDYSSAIMKDTALLSLILALASAKLVAAEEPERIVLWPNGAPGFAERRNEPEVAKEYWVRNVHNPSLTALLPPKEKSTGAAVIICPGGGHRELVFNAEGVQPAQYFSGLGVAAFVLKYRLGRETNTVYSIQKHAREDGQRAMRLVRANASQWNLDPHRIGMVGFSAGGEVVSLVAYGPVEGDPNAADPIDRLSCRPDFQIVIYPGPLGIPDVLPPNAPPAFFLVANDDDSHVRPITTLLEKYRSAKLPIEVHLFARGGHGFNMGSRSKLKTISNWPRLMGDWMADNNLLDPAVPPRGTK